MAYNRKYDLNLIYLQTGVFGDTVYLIVVQLMTIFIMKTHRLFISAVVMASLSLPAAAQKAVEKEAAPEHAGTLTYCLPKTTVSFEVKAERETFYAGPYAEFARKYLGIDAQKEDYTRYRLTEVRMTPYTEADQTARYLLKVGAQGVDASFLKLTSCGLVSLSDASYQESVWRFPTVDNGDFSDDGQLSSVASESTTLYRNVKGESAYTRVAVQQEVMVAKTLERKAAETAALIFDLRKKRIQIITGDTDATYSGEAMGAAVAEITRLEKEYMTLFTGYSVTSVQTMRCDLVPEREKKMYVAFRMSETAGLLPADDLSGKPVVLEIAPEPESQPGNPVESKSEGRKLSRDVIYAMYRVPAVCTLKLTDGSELLLTSRLPLYQFGYDATFPLTVKVR